MRRVELKRNEQHLVTVIFNQLILLHPSVQNKASSFYKKLLLLSFLGDRSKTQYNDGCICTMLAKYLGDYILYPIFLVCYSFSDLCSFFMSFKFVLYLVKN